jgi:hypothetical protein
LFQRHNRTASIEAAAKVVAASQSRACSVPGYRHLRLNALTNVNVLDEREFWFGRLQLVLALPQQPTNSLYRVFATNGMSRRDVTKDPTPGGGRQHLPTLDQLNELTERQIDKLVRDTIEQSQDVTNLPDQVMPYSPLVDICALGADKALDGLNCLAWKDAHPCS